MNKLLRFIFCVTAVLVLTTAGFSKVSAEEKAVQKRGWGFGSGKGLKEGSADLKAQKTEVKDQLRQGLKEEEQLRNKIQQALKEGDKSTAQKLRLELKNMHRENVRQMQQEKQELKLKKQESKQDLKEQIRSQRPDVFKSSQPGLSSGKGRGR